MSAHPTAELKAPPLMISAPSLPSTDRPDGDAGTASSAATPTVTSPLEPHWELVVSAATD